MAQQATLSPHSIRELQTQSLRLTAFLAPSEETTEPTWWRDTIGAHPETKTTKLGRKVSEEMGPVGEGLMVLTTQPGRVDWNFVPRSEEGLPPEVRFVGTFVDTVDLFSQIMGRWLGNAPALVRLAFGAIVHQPVQDKAEAYRYLAKSLPAVNLDVENSEDFIYQINRPRQSTVVQGLKINRLGKWSAALFLGVRFDMTKQMISRHLAGGEYTCRLELDINTDALFPGELPGTQLHAVFEELKNLGMEMADRGDVA